MEQHSQNRQAYNIIEHFEQIFKCFLKNKLYLEIILGLRESFAKVIQSFHIPLARFPLLLTSNMTMVHLSKLRNQHKCYELNWRFYSNFTSCSINASFLVPESNPILSTFYSWKDSHYLKCVQTSNIFISCCFKLENFKLV